MTAQAPVDSRSAADDLPLWRLHLLRAGYLVLGAGLAVTKWPLFLDDAPWSLMDGVVTCMLTAMSLLAFLGLRYPLRMLPLLLFEVLWKVIWLAVVAIPQWSADEMDAATREVANACLLVVIFLVVVPWRHVAANYAAQRGDRWR